VFNSHTNKHKENWEVALPNLSLTWVDLCVKGVLIPSHVSHTFLRSPDSWMAMSGFVSVGYNPQPTDISVCFRPFDNVGPTRRRHSVKSAIFCLSGETVANTSTNNSGIVGK
jgi:hypothetical protein